MRTIKVLSLGLAVAYVVAYVAVRVTHTQRWFDKTTEETGSYTLFDTYSRMDMVLYRGFTPLIALDSFLFRRDCVRDKL